MSPLWISNSTTRSAPGWPRCGASSTENVTPALRAELAEHGQEFPGGELAAFRRKIGERGWFGLNWPPEYGGLGLTAMYQHLLMREFEYWGVPGPDLTVTSVAPMIMRHGTEQNKLEFLPPIARGEIDLRGRLLRARSRHRPGQPAHPGGARRRRVGHHRIQDLEQRRPTRRRMNGSVCAPIPMRRDTAASR